MFFAVFVTTAVAALANSRFTESSIVGGRTRSSVISAGFKHVEALGRIIIGGPYPPSNAIIYMHLQL